MARPTRYGLANYGYRLFMQLSDDDKARLQNDEVRDCLVKLGRRLKLSAQAEAAISRFVRTGRFGE